MKLTEKQLKSMIEKCVEKSTLQDEELEKFFSKYKDENNKISTQDQIMANFLLNIDFTKKLIYNSLKSILLEIDLLTDETSSETEE